jgi:AcrR family transcriptional regulator
VASEDRSTDTPPGLRERKRRDTLRRITDAGISLFIEKGIDATTVDEIAAASGISRRTFFHYFESKDDILLSLQSGLGEMIAEQVRTSAPDRRPLDAVRDALITVCATIPADDMVAIDRLMRGSASVQARKQASYVQHEGLLFSALRERWADERRAAGLRLVAMVAIGALRLASEAFGRDAGSRTFEQVLGDAFDALESEMVRDARHG